MTTSLFSVVILGVVVTIGFQFLKRVIKRLYKVEKFAVDLLLHFLKRNRGFDMFIPLSSCIQDNTITCTNQTLSFDYKIPTCLTKEGYLDLGGILALTDVVTSIVVLLYDQSHRAGVSVSLSGQTHANHFKSNEEYRNKLKANSIIHIEARVSKTGSNISFSSMTISTPENEIIATTSHLKFMPSGLLWNTFGFLIPNLFYIKLKFFPKRFLRKDYRDESAEDLTVYSCLKLQPVEEITSTSSSSNSLSTHTWICHKFVMNLFKAIHGGAIACVFYEVGMKCVAADSVMSKDGSFVHYMNIEYISAAKGHLKVITESQQITPTDSISFTREKSTKTSRGQSLKIKLMGNDSKNASSAQKTQKLFAQARVLIY